jgi:hypothetical protein
MFSDEFFLILFDLGDALSFEYISVLSSTGFLVRKAFHNYCRTVLDSEFQPTRMYFLPNLRWMGHRAFPINLYPQLK